MRALLESCLTLRGWWAYTFVIERSARIRSKRKIASYDSKISFYRHGCGKDPELTWSGAGLGANNAELREAWRRCLRGEPLRQRGRLSTPSVTLSEARQALDILHREDRFLADAGAASVRPGSVVRGLRDLEPRSILGLLRRIVREPREIDVSFGFETPTLHGRAISARPVLLAIPERFDVGVAIEVAAKATPSRIAALKRAIGQAGFVGRFVSSRTGSVAVVTRRVRSATNVEEAARRSVRLARELCNGNGIA